MVFICHEYLASDLKGYRSRYALDHPATTLLNCKYLHLSYSWLLNHCNQLLQFVIGDYFDFTNYHPMKTQIHWFLYHCRIQGFMHCRNFDLLAQGHSTSFQYRLDSHIGAWNALVSEFSHFEFIGHSRALLVDFRHGFHIFSWKID